jgi:hypothetical protein
LGGHRYHKKKVKLRKPKSIASKTKNVKHQKQKVAPSGPEYYKNKHLGDQGRKEGGSRKEGRKDGYHFEALAGQASIFIYFVFKFQ